MKKKKKIEFLGEKQTTTERDIARRGAQPERDWESGREWRKMPAHTSRMTGDAKPEWCWPWWGKGAAACYKLLQSEATPAPCHKRHAQASSTRMAML